MPGRIMRYVSFALPGCARVCSKRRPSLRRPQPPLYFGLRKAQSIGTVVELPPDRIQGIGHKKHKKTQKTSSTIPVEKRQHSGPVVPFCVFRGYQANRKICSIFPRSTRRPSSMAAVSLQPRSTTKRSARILARMRLYMANLGSTNSSLYASL
jgi:hypothetical protein